MKDWPIVLGYEIDDAKKILEEAGLKYEVVETESPKGIDHEGTYRVIKQINSKENILVLTVCQI